MTLSTSRLKLKDFNSGVGNKRGPDPPARPFYAARRQLQKNE